ncbi:MAG: hypothetical protein H7Z14_06205, partial [Anaerolineae bacterium]|nr:hypothetical protein [Phycisphaerae bacterium]
MQIARSSRAHVLAVLSAAAVAAATASVASADVFFDSTGPTEHFSDSWADIASVEVTNDATNITFKINLNPLMNDGVTANNIQTNNFTKYDIGIHTGPGGSTALAVDYSQIFGLSTGMNYWVRSWANQGVNLGGYQAFAWNGSNFNTASPVATSSTVPIDPTATTLT